MVDLIILIIFITIVIGYLSEEKPIGFGQGQRCPRKISKNELLDKIDNLNKLIIHLKSVGDYPGLTEEQRVQYISKAEEYETRLIYLTFLKNNRWYT